MSPQNMMYLVLKYAFTFLLSILALNALFLGLVTIPWIQAHLAYTHKLKRTWFKDLNLPEQFGFLRNQVTPFLIPTPTSNGVHAWHILPIRLYHKHEAALVNASSGFAARVTSQRSFQLLHEDPDARLVIHFHGAGGILGSGYRVPNYRALSAADLDKIHVLTFDYGGFGRSSGQGTPSERGLVADGIAALDWAMNVAGVPPSRIAANLWELLSLWQSRSISRPNPHRSSLLVPSSSHHLSMPPRS